MKSRSAKAKNKSVPPTPQQKKASTGRSQIAPPARRSERKIRYAVVGLGHIAQVAVLPAFAGARNCELAALVSDDEAKRRRLGRDYGVRLSYGYAQYEDCLNSGEIDAVYIALPNHLHREYAVRAARAGIHVLCEKPMALTEEDCEAMIAASEQSGTRLMIAYRLHFEAANLCAVEIARSGKLGEPRYFISAFSQVVKSSNVRLSAPKGGGTLWDMGIYCINAARYLFREEPIEVTAFTATPPGDERFREVEEMTGALLRFPGDRLASFVTSFGAAATADYRIVGTKGELRVEQAYEYAEPMKQTLTLHGKTKIKKTIKKFARRDQFAPELIYFSECILKEKEPTPSGQEGLADIRIIRALYRSAETGRSVRLGDFDVPVRPTLAQEIRVPQANSSEPLVHVESPSGS